MGWGGGGGLTTSRHAEQRGQYLVVAGGWGGGAVNQQTCWTKRPVPCWGGGWGGGLSTSRHAEQRPVPYGGGANKQAKQRGQYLVVVGVPTSKLNKEASTLLWRWTARRLWLSHNQHAGGPWSCFQIVHCDGPRFHMLCLQPSETVQIQLFPLTHTPLIPLDFTCFVSSPLKQYQFISFLLFTHLLFL